MKYDAERTGVLLVRIWTESTTGSLRARITQTLDVERREQTSQAVATVEQILTTVREWIDAFVVE
jgi:hypothetical protein